MLEPYRTSIHKGDIVQMPNGTFGIINYWDIYYGGHIMKVRVYPFVNWLYRLFLTLTEKTWFVEEEIDTLNPIYFAPRHLSRR